MKVVRAYVGVGSNLGNRLGMMGKAKERLEANRFISIRKVSKVYETQPAGYLPQNQFLNAVWELETELPPAALLRELVTVENYLGRKSGVRNGPRVIDLDLLGYGNFISQQSELMVPHPRLHERYFVLKPFSEVNARWIHPKFHCTVRELLAKVSNRP